MLQVPQHHAVTKSQVKASGTKEAGTQEDWNDAGSWWQWLEFSRISAFLWVEWEDSTVMILLGANSFGSPLPQPPSSHKTPYLHPAATLLIYLSLGQALSYAGLQPMSLVRYVFIVRDISLYVLGIFPDCALHMSFARQLQNSWCWWFGLVVMAFCLSTKSRYIKPS